MTNQQKKFCDEYLLDCNATRAYKAAYPRIKSDHAARSCASRLLTNADIKSYIDEQLDKISSEKIADATEVMEYLSSVMRGQSESEIVVIEGIGEGCSDARRMNKMPDEKERLKAAELLGKRYGLFRDEKGKDADSAYKDAAKGAIEAILGQISSCKESDIEGGA